MKQKFKKYLFLTLFLSCLFSGFLGVAQTDDEDSIDSLLGLTSQEITCDNMTDVLEEYNNIVQLMEDTFSESLYNMSNAINDIDSKGRLLRSELQNQKQQIDQARQIIDESRYQISQKGDNILSVLQGCLRN